METIDAILDELDRLSITELRSRFAEVLGYRSNSRSRQFLIRKIVWGFQATEHGDISEIARKQAEELADDRALQYRLSKPKPATSMHVRTGILNSNHDARLPVPGTILTRKYRGNEIGVLVMEAGFEWKGRKFNSLSSIAREVTGTRWNGYAFFGLGKAA